MTTVFEIGRFRDVHDIQVTTAKGRYFTIDIYNEINDFKAEVTVLDKISNVPGSWIFQTDSVSNTAVDNFQAGVALIKKYLEKMDPNDTIKDIHNPCNTPFVSLDEQNAVLSKIGIELTARVN